MKLDMLIILAGITFFASCNDKDPESALKGCCRNQAIDEAVGNGHIYIGNIFTPNNDGRNDHMAISTQGIDLIVEVEVRNKQGEKVFESTTVEINNSQTSWDGKVDGVVKAGVYTISVSVLAADGTSRTLTGSVCNYPCDGEGNLESISTDNCTFPEQVDNGHYGPMFPSGEHMGCFE